MPKFNIIVATSSNMGIGKGGNLPWKLKGELKWFQDITMKTRWPQQVNAIIMGRNTWDSLPDGRKPLQGRVNIIVSRSLKMDVKPSSVYTATSLNAALECESSLEDISDVFIIGGNRLYSEALSHPDLDCVYMTKIDHCYDCDVYFPPYSDVLEEVDGSPKYTEYDTNISREVSYRVVKFKVARNIIGNIPQRVPYDDYLTKSGYDKRIRSSMNPEEARYLSYINYIMDHGNLKSDRTGVGTKSIYGVTLRYSLENNTWPILTTKKVFAKGIIEELLWFISGKTDGKILLNKGIKIWRGNGTREFLDNNGLVHYEEHDLGPIYGHQWRHSGAQYTDCKADYSGKGVDQLSNVIKQLTDNPDSRRHIICSWNPIQIKQMALPPCHVLVQFYVANGELSCMMYQRSLDEALGCPYNIASYSLLTHMIAHLTGFKAKEFIHVSGDTHVYLNHFEGVREQITREPYQFPKVNFKRKVANIDDFKYEDIELVGYRSHPPIKFEMAI
jgi:dihydrofolate reductase/thymidylate synthase